MPGLTIDIDTQARDVKRGIADANRQIDLFSKGTLRSFGKLGGALGVTLGLKQIGSAAISAFKDIDAAQRTLTRELGASGEELKRLENSTRDVFSGVPESMTEVAGAVAEVSKLFGAQGQQLQNLTTLTLDFGRVTGTDGVRSVNRIAGAMRLFGVSVSETDETLSDIIKASREFSVSTDTLVSGLEQYAGTFAALGFNLEESISLMGQFQRAGVPITKIGEGLAQFIPNVLKSGRDVRTEFERWIGLFAQGEEGVYDFNEAVKFFGAESINALIEAAPHLDLSETLGRNKGLLSDVARESLTVGQRFEIVGNQVQEALIPVFEQLAPVLEEAAEVAGEFIRTWQTRGLGDAISGVLLPTLKDIATAVWDAEGAVGLLTHALIGLGAVKVTKSIAVTIAQIVELATATGHAADAAGGAKGLTPALGRIGAKVGIIGGLTVGGILAVKHWDDITKAMQRAGNEFDDWIERAAEEDDGILGGFAKLADNITNTLAGAEDAVRRATGGGDTRSRSEAIDTFFHDAADAAYQGFIDFFDRTGEVRRRREAVAREREQIEALRGQNFTEIERNQQEFFDQLYGRGGLFGAAGVRFEGGLGALQETAEFAAEANAALADASAEAADALRNTIASIITPRQDPVTLAQRLIDSGVDFGATGLAEVLGLQASETKDFNESFRGYLQDQLNAYSAAVEAFEGDPEKFPEPAEFDFSGLIDAFPAWWGENFPDIPIPEDISLDLDELFGVPLQDNDLIDALNRLTAAVAGFTPGDGTGPAQPGQLPGETRAEFEERVARGYQPTGFTGQVVSSRQIGPEPQQAGFSTEGRLGLSPEQEDAWQDALNTITTAFPSLPDRPGQVYIPDLGWVDDTGAPTLASLAGLTVPDADAARDAFNLASAGATTGRAAETNRAIRQLAADRERTVRAQGFGAVGTPQAAATQFAEALGLPPDTFTGLVSGDNRVTGPGGALLSAALGLGGPGIGGVDLAVGQGGRSFGALNAAIRGQTTAQAADTERVLRAAASGGGAGTAADVAQVADAFASLGGGGGTSAEEAAVRRALGGGFDPGQRGIGPGGTTAPLPMVTLEDDSRSPIGSFIEEARDSSGLLGLSVPAIINGIRAAGALSNPVGVALGIAGWWLGDTLIPEWLGGSPAYSGTVRQSGATTNYYPAGTDPGQRARAQERERQLGYLERTFGGRYG